MNTFSRNPFAALMGAAILSSCSRPVAYFQPSQREQYKSPQPQTVAVVTPAEVAQPAVIAETPAAEVAPVAAPAPAEQTAQVRQVMSQVEAYVRNDSKLASNKKLAKHIERANQLLATSNTKTAVATTAGATKKMSLMERTMLKKMDKKIKNHVAPDDSKALNRNTRNGIIIGAIGLLLSLIFGGVIGVIGLILLIVGIVLILLGVLE